jgi:ElaB/YqjD/DUF883 family membrane-anchored ribosome-binding protein
MGERADEVRREPNPLVDPVDGPEVVRSQIGPDPALGDGGAVVDEAEVERVEIERTRAEIERTRAEMGETVDVIQQRLSPESLKEQAKDKVKEATVGKAQGAGSTIVETITANPVPAALTGIGLGWLFMSARRQSSAPPRYRDTTYAYPPRYEERDPSGPTAGQTVERARDKVGETASQAQDKAGQVAGQAQDQVSRLGDQARYQARRASGGFHRMLQENPLVVGALAVGTGAAVGLTIPETSKEHEVMGEARDTFVERAREAQQKVQRVAEEAQSAAKDEAENQGLAQE